MVYRGKTYRCVLGLKLRETWVTRTGDRVLERRNGKLFYRPIWRRKTGHPFSSVFRTDTDFHGGITYINIFRLVLTAWVRRPVKGEEAAHWPGVSARRCDPEAGRWLSKSRHGREHAGMNNPETKAILVAYYANTLGASWKVRPPPLWKSRRRDPPKKHRPRHTRRKRDGKK